MKQTTKRKIAREVLILFGSVVLIGLIWTIFWTTNKIRTQKTENLKIEIANYNHDIDSIQKTFPKTKSFQEITKKDWYQYIVIDKNLCSELDELNSKVDGLQNIVLLFKLLIESNYPFVENKATPSTNDKFGDFTVCFGFFLDEVLAELKSDTLDLDNLNTTTPHLKKYHQFLTDKKLIDVTIQEFVLTLNAMPLPPKHETWVVYQNDKKKLDELRNDLSITTSKAYSTNELTGIAKWISIIVLTLVYPFRFLLLLLKWALRTLRQDTV